MKSKVKTNPKVKKQKTVQKQQKCNKKNYKPKKKNIKLRRAVAVLILIVIILATLVLILLSDLFNIKKITVKNNSKISENEIIEKSQLAIGQNMFKTFSKAIKEGIKTNPYIDDVKVKKKLNGEIEIEVKERVATYMLQCETGYAYINNQGYILEFTEVLAELPIIKGYKTQDITLGNRLITEDLEQLDTVIQIIEAAKSNNISDKIYAIDISKPHDFVLEIPSEEKTVQFGDKTNINVKILWIQDLLNETKGTPGEIVLNVPNIKKVYFRERV